MKIVRFSNAGKINCGILRDGRIAVIAGDIYGDWHETEENVPLSEVKLSVRWTRFPCSASERTTRPMPTSANPISPLRRCCSSRRYRV